MIVPDASAIIELLLRTPTGALVQHRIFPSRESLHAPYLLDAEVAKVLRRSYLRGVLDEGRAREAMDDLQDLTLVRYPHVPLLRRAWELRHNLQTFDAIYVALAEELDAALLTTDARIAQAPVHSARVEVFEFVN